MKGIWRTNPAEGPAFPDWTKLSARGVTDFYVPALSYDKTTGKYVPNTRQVNPTYCRDILSRMGYRIYRDPSWDSTHKPEELVAKALMDVREVVDMGYVPYMYDIEYHDPSFVIKTIKAHRLVFPKGPVAWTLEPWQGGWFTPELVDVVNRDPNLVVVVQNFFAGMQPAGTRNGETCDQELRRVGI